MRPVFVMSLKAESREPLLDCWRETSQQGVSWEPDATGSSFFSGAPESLESPTNTIHIPISTQNRRGGVNLFLVFRLPQEDSSEYHNTFALH